jgi:hypothetical protein
MGDTKLINFWHIITEHTINASVNGVMMVGNMLCYVAVASFGLAWIVADDLVWQFICYPMVSDIKDGKQVWIRVKKDQCYGGCVGVCYGTTSDGCWLCGCGL